MKNVTLSLSSEVSVEGIGIVKKGWIISVKDEFAEKLKKIGFTITAQKITHEFDNEKNEWIEVVKSKKQGGEN